MPRWADKELAGWGRVWRAKSATARPERIAELGQIFRDAESSSLLAHGSGRSYGDVAINGEGRSVVMRRCDRLLDFDPATGRLVAEPGVTIAELMEVFIPRGFIPPVVPGTGFVTLGGAIANDIHGKNHHNAGSFGHHLEWVDLRLPGGETRRVAADSEDALFRATLGGAGLTGIVEKVCLRLKPVVSNAVSVRKRRIRDLDHYFEAFSEEQDRADYIVGWIDALAKGRDTGRGILEAASPSPESVVVRAGKPLGIPFDLPAFALNSTTVRLFNQAYYGRIPRSGVELAQPYRKFMFPLDAIHDWNRIYGKRGFHQFQCVVPFAEGRSALIKMLDLIAQSGRGSFLAVIKAMGPQGLGFLSFSRPGYTLALDFPNAADARELIARLEGITCDHGGRTYLAKDSTLAPELLPRMYPDLERYREVLADIDPHGRMQSDLAHRLKLRGEK